MGAREIFKLCGVRPGSQMKEAADRGGLSRKPKERRECGGDRRRNEKT
jgi:hypothetical protein